MTKKQQDAAARAEFHFARNQARLNGWEDKLNCFGREDDFVHYEVPPTQEEAEEMCAGCPMLTVCRAYARAVKPGWTVLGGISWDDGRRAQNNLEKIAA